MSREMVLKIIEDKKLTNYDFFEGKRRTSDEIVILKEGGKWIVYATSERGGMVTNSEDGKPYSSKDDFVRLYVFPNKVSEKVFTFEDVVKRFSVVKPYYPLWVTAYVKEDNIVELHTCMRFRKPSLVFKNETGTEPFRLIEIL